MFSFRQRLLTAEAIVWLCCARLAIALFPFRWIARYLGCLHKPDNPSFASRKTSVSAHQVRLAIQRGAGKLPFPLVCLTRALAGWQMLKVRSCGSRLHVGAQLRSLNGKRMTHAWLDCGQVQITGFPVQADFVEIGFFATSSFGWFPSNFSKGKRFER